MTHGVLTQELMLELATAAQSDGTMTRNEFGDLLNRTVAALRLNVDEVARICYTSRFTAQRWLSGTATPHRVGRPSVFLVLHRFAIQQQINQ